MKRIFAAVLAALITMPLLADNTKLRVAVFDPSSSGTSIDEGTKIAIREIISSTMVNSGSFEIVERSLLEKVMQEQSFSNSGAVNDTDATEIGKLAGANKVVISVVTLTGGRNMLSVKMIDVKTASVDRQKVKVVSSGELLDVIEPLTLSLINTDNSFDDDSGSVTVAPSVASVIDNGNKPSPQPGEVVFWLPEGFQPKNSKDRHLPLLVSVDSKDVGSGTLTTGFLIRIQNPSSGVHTLKVGSIKMEIDLDKYDFFELQLYMTNSFISIGSPYGVSIKEQKRVNAVQKPGLSERTTGLQAELEAIFEPCGYMIPAQYDRYLETEYFPIMSNNSQFNVVLDFSDAKIEGKNMMEYLASRNKLNEAFISDMDKEMRRFVAKLGDENKKYYWAYKVQAPVTLVVKFRDVSADGKTTLADYVFVESDSGNVLTGIRMTAKGGKRGSVPNLIADGLTDEIAPEIVKYLKKKKIGR